MLVYYGEKHETSGVWLEPGYGQAKYGGDLVISSNAEVMAVASEADAESHTVPVYVFGTPAVP